MSIWVVSPRFKSHKNLLLALWDFFFKSLSHIQIKNEKQKYELKGMAQWVHFCFWTQLPWFDSQYFKMKYFIMLFVIVHCLYWNFEYLKLHFWLFKNSSIPSLTKMLMFPNLFDLAATLKEELSRTSCQGMGCHGTIWRSV